MRPLDLEYSLSILDHCENGFAILEGDRRIGVTAGESAVSIRTKLGAVSVIAGTIHAGACAPCEFHCGRTSIPGHGHCVNDDPTEVELRASEHRVIGSEAQRTEVTSADFISSCEGLKNNIGLTGTLDGHQIDPEGASTIHMAGLGDGNDLLIEEEAVFASDPNVCRSDLVERGLKRGGRDWIDDACEGGFGSDEADDDEEQADDVCDFHGDAELAVWRYFYVKRHPYEYRYNNSTDSRQCQV